MRNDPRAANPMRRNRAIKQALEFRRILALVWKSSARWTVASAVLLVLEAALGMDHRALSNVKRIPCYGPQWQLSRVVRDAGVTALSGRRATLRGRRILKIQLQGCRFIVKIPYENGNSHKVSGKRKTAYIRP